MSRAWVLLAVVTCVACSDDGGGGAASDAGSGPVDAPSDLGLPGGIDAAADTGGTAAGADADGGGGAEVAGGGVTIGLGGPCAEDGDCDEGFCADTPAGHLCTQLCSGDCPPGLRCEVVTGDGGFQQLCLPAFPRLCRPCVSNADCAPAGLALGQRCVDLGAAGAFCGGDCAAVACPVGFACEERPDVTGEVTPQCVAVTGQCGCSPDAVADGASTLCWHEGEAGRCEGTRTCTADGLTACDAASPSHEECNGADDDCDGQVDEGLGAEPCAVTGEAGTCGGTRACVGGAWLCDAPAPAPEVCDGADDDCDGEADEEGAGGCTPRYEDVDGDGWGTGPSRCLCSPAGAFTATVGGDCADGDAAVHPGAAEACNGKDDDCAGGTDGEGAAGCVVLRKDADGDGYGVLGVEACLCAAAAPWADVPGGDCNDGAPGVHPGAPEVCNGKDDDCDGAADPAGAEGCTPWLRDADGDGAGVDGDVACLCAPAPPYAATAGGDCDDGKAAVKPGQLELCNGVDDDCDGVTDGPGSLGCTPWLRDEDGDGYGVSGESQCLCAAEAPWTAVVGGDCNDAAAGVVPGQLEACNGADDDCDGATDEAGAIGCAVYYADADGDGLGALADSACLCAPAVPYVAVDAGDCDDADAGVAPGVIEVCNGKDDDCDVAVDEVGAVGCQERFEDGDGDGWGTDASLCLCAAVGDYAAAQPGDCDDDDPQAAPDRPEQCDGADDDCDGQVDEADALGCALWYADGDGDGWGDPASGACLCAPSGANAVGLGGDCDDGDAGRAPDQPEECDGVDDDCDGAVDEGCGMPVLGWPTFGADVRRSGQAFLEQGPAGANPAWSVPLGGVVVGSPVILPDGAVYAATANLLTRVGAGGTLDWQLPVPAPIVGQAGPTARLGGTVLVGATEWLVHVAPDGEPLWAATVEGAPIEASPVVDAVGRIYVLARGAVTRFDVSGAKVWVALLPDGVTAVGHPAITTSGAILVATSTGGLRALDSETGALLWSHASGAASGTGALALGATGIAYYGTSAGVSAVTVTGAPFASWTGAPAPAALGVFNTAYLCCIPKDQVLVGTSAATGLYKRSADLASSVWQKAPGTAWPVATDYDGDIWVTSTDGMLVRLDVSGAQSWVYAPPGATVTTPPAVGAGLVVIGDSDGVLRALGD